MITRFMRDAASNFGSVLRDLLPKHGTRNLFAVTTVSPPDFIHSAAFSEIAETLHHGLLSLGYNSVLTNHGALEGCQHIVLGSHLLPRYPLPLAKDAILYNLEQATAGLTCISPEVIDIFRQHVVWDYSKRNAAAIVKLGVKVARRAGAMMKKLSVFKRIAIAAILLAHWRSVRSAASARRG